MEQASKAVQAHYYTVPLYSYVIEKTIILRIQSSSHIYDSAICKEESLAWSYYALHYTMKGIIR